jgi:Na+/alanine symporter
MFLLSSIGFASMAFSNSFNKYQKIIQIIALSIFAFSAVYGYKATNDFKQYLDYMDQQDDIPEPHNSQLKEWRGWITLTYIYMFILLVTSSIIFIRKVRG